MKPLRVAVALASASFALVLAADAHGGDAPRFSDLPVGRVTSPPTKRLSWVSPHERVPGLFVTSPKWGNDVPPQDRHVSVSADAKVAAAIKKGDGFAFESGLPEACVSEMGGAFEEPDEDDDVDEAREWSENVSFEVDAYPRHRENPMTGVIAVHSERVVEDGSGGATLESVDAWVDPSTRGAKLIAKATLPMRLVRGSTYGLKVYAGRDERADGRKLVQFVVLRGPHQHPERVAPMISFRQSGSSMGHASGCGHMRVGLPVETHGAESATVVTSVVLPSPDKPRPSDTEREIRMREVRVQLSVSQTTRDKEPLVSASLGWGGREQVQRVPIEAPEGQRD